MPVMASLTIKDISCSCSHDEDDFIHLYFLIKKKQKVNLQKQEIQKYIIAFKRMHINYIGHVQFGNNGNCRKTVRGCILPPLYLNCAEYYIS